MNICLTRATMPISTISTPAQDCVKSYLIKEQEAVTKSISAGKDYHLTFTRCN